MFIYRDKIINHSLEKDNIVIEVDRLSRMKYFIVLKILMNNTYFAQIINYSISKIYKFQNGKFTDITLEYIAKNAPKIAKLVTIS